MIEGHHLYFTPDEPPVRGFQEVVFSVSNIERWIGLMERVCEWEVISKAEHDTNLNTNWQLAADVTIREAVLCKPGTRQGYLRLVQFGNVEQRQIRSATHVWDTGGIFDVNIRTRDIAALYRELEDEGWHGYSEPHRYVFDVYDVSEVLMRGPDGIVIAFIQRFAPKLSGYDEMGKTSRIFNSSIVARDMAATRAFYVDQLGFSLTFQSPGTARSGGANVLGLPANLNPEISVPIDIVRPGAAGTGSIEYLQTTELQGKDCAPLAHAPNLGILLHRFPVRDAEAYATTLQDRGVSLDSKLRTIDSVHYGMLKVFSVRSPDGAWLEFVQKLK